MNRNEITLGLVQMSMTADKEKNLDKAVKMIINASKKGAHIVCLPELFTSTYFPQEETFEARSIAEPIPGPTTNRLSQVARENKIILVGGSVCEIYKNKLFNTTVVFDQKGKAIGKYRKVHIPQDPQFYEQNYFEKGDLGYQVSDTSIAKIGTLICYDQWYPEAARINSLMGADIIFYPTAIGTVDGVEQKEGSWQEAWESVQRGHSIANSVIISAVNRVGKEGRMNFWGGSFVADQFGKVLVRGDDKEKVIIAKCNLDLGKDIREGWRFFYNRRPDTYQKILKK